MKNVLFLVATLLSGTLALNAQTSYPKGSYMSLEEIVTKSPTGTHDLVVKVSKSGSEANVTSKDKNVKKKTINKEIWAVSDGENFVLNTAMFEYDSDYIKVQSEGKYLPFLAGVSKKDAAVAGVAGGIMGGAIASSIRKLYIMDSENGLVFKADKNIVSEFLQEYPEIQSEYENEKDPKDSEVIISYIRKLNSKLKE